MIVLNTLRYANELRPAKDLEIPAKNLKTAGVTPRELEMATKLVEEMSDRWKPTQFKDTYHDDLMRLINKRIKAGKTEVITTPDKDEEERPARAKVVDLMALLKRSVQRSGKPKRQTPKSERQAGRKTA
jgi:DNA end-binding protein Ku